MTGVSGSGKSTLIHDVLYRNLLRARGESSDQEPGACKSVTGAHRVGDVVMVDQSPLARTPRSTPILYLGLYDRVRELFAAQPEAMSQGLTASAFSFNSGSGRCERCCGTGFEKIEMQFLSDLYVRCAECEGRRFQPHVLESEAARQIDSRSARADGERSDRSFSRRSASGKRLSDPLDVLEKSGSVICGSVNRSTLFRAANRSDSNSLGIWRETGRPRSTGKSERERRRTGNLFIFDEPTTGLHFDDVAILLQLFQRLVDAGHSIVVIEHNLEVIKCADWIIDLGPEAGDDGGEVVATGTPEQIATR